MEAYSNFIRREESWISPLLDTVRNLTLFLPGRFAHSELRSEAIYTTVNLIQAQHDRILDRSRLVTAELKAGPDNPKTQTCQNILIAFHYSEVLFEMMAQKLVQHLAINNYIVNDQLLHQSTRPSIQQNLSFTSQQTFTSSPSPLTNTRPQLTKSAKFNQFLYNKWTFLSLIESIKATCRLYMLYNNSGRMLIQPSQQELATKSIRRSRDRRKQLTIQSCLMPAVAIAGMASQAKFQPNVLTSEPAQNLIEMYIEHGRFLSKEGSQTDTHVNHHGQFGKLEDSNQSSNIHPRERYSFKPPVKEIVSEVLFILRPVIYCIARIFCRQDSWRPFFISCITDVLSRMLLPSLMLLSPAQRITVIKRMIYWAYYLLRSPFFDRFTKAPLIKTTQILGKIPIIGILATNLGDLIVALQSHYFYVSNS